MTVNDIIQFTLAFCGGITVIFTAAGLIYRAIIKAKEPGQKVNNTLNEHERRLNEHDIYLNKDKKSIDAINESSRVTQKALLAITGYLITPGESKEALVDARDELHTFLLNK